MKHIKELLFSVSLLSSLALTSCSNKKPESNDTGKNLLGITSNAQSQILRPCHWTFSVDQDANGEPILVSTAKLDSGWHLYSQHIAEKGSPTKFVYRPLPHYKLVGATQEEKPHEEYNPYLEMDVLYFENSAVFKQKINVQSKEDFTIDGNVDYMVCLTQCVPSDEDFSFNVKGNN